MLRRHGLTTADGMIGLQMDSYDQDVKTWRDTTMELHAEAHDKEESNDMRNAPTEKSTLTPITKGPAQRSNKFKLNGASGAGGVKKKQTTSSKKRPAHWRKVALRQMFAGIFYLVLHQLVFVGPHTVTCMFCTCHTKLINKVQVATR